MGLLDRFRGRQSEPTPPDLVGVWHLVHSDALPQQEAELDIRGNGQMSYSIRDGDKWQIIKLTYQLEGDTLVSNQPSAPREERTAFRVEADGTLLLSFGGERSWFRRGVKRAPLA